MPPRVDLRWKLYLFYAAGWLALLVWLPAIRASMAAGKPHGWIAMPTFTDLRTAYLFAIPCQWLSFFKRHSLEVGFQIVSRTTEFAIYVPLAVVLLLGLRRICKVGMASHLRSQGCSAAFRLRSVVGARGVVCAFSPRHASLRSQVFPAQWHRPGDRPGSFRRCARRRQTDPVRAGRRA